MVEDEYKAETACYDRCYTPHPNACLSNVKDLVTFHNFTEISPVNGFWPRGLKITRSVSHVMLKK